jgi:hypothetical protein
LLSGSELGIARRGVLDCENEDIVHCTGKNFFFVLGPTYSAAHKHEDEICHCRRQQCGNTILYCTDKRIKLFMQ